MVVSFSYWPTGMHIPGYSAAWIFACDDSVCLKMGCWGNSTILMLYHHYSICCYWTCNKKGAVFYHIFRQIHDQAGKLTLSVAGHSCCFMLLILNSYSWCWWQKEKNRMIFPQNIHISSGQGDRNPISGAATRRAARWWKGAYTIWVDHKVNGRWIEGFKQQDLCCSHTGLDV